MVWLAAFGTLCDALDHFFWWSFTEQPKRYQSPGLAGGIFLLGCHSWDLTSSPMWHLETERNGLSQQCQQGEGSGMWGCSRTTPIQAAVRSGCPLVLLPQTCTAQHPSGCAAVPAQGHVSGGQEQGQGHTAGMEEPVWCLRSRSAGWAAVQSSSQASPADAVPWLPCPVARAWCLQGATGGAISSAN